MEIRLNIFDEKNKWVGQEYLTEKGKWIHRWVHNGKLEKGGWRGRATGSNELEWKYKVVEDELPNEASGLHKHFVKRSTSAFMLIAKTQPKVINANVPIYWKKYVAEQDADLFGGKVVKCDITW